MSRLTRNGTANHDSRDQIIRREREQSKKHSSCSADHELDWQPHPVDPYSTICDDHKYSSGDIRIWTVTARVTRLSSPVSSTNDDPRIQQKSPGKTLKIQRIRPMSKNFMFL